MTVSKKKAKKEIQNSSEKLIKQSRCIPGSSNHSCTEHKQSQRHTDTYHNDYFSYKHFKVYRVPNTLYFTCPGNDCQEHYSYSNMKRHLMFCLKLNQIARSVTSLSAISTNSAYQTVNLTEETTLIYDPHGDSIIAFNSLYGIAICTVHQIGLDINAIENENGVTVGFSYGTNHLKQHHFKDKDYQGWLSDYLLNKLYQNQDLFNKSMEQSASLRNQLSNLNEPIKAIEGLSIHSGLECLFCNHPKAYFKILINSSKESHKTKNLRRHYQTDHQDNIQASDKSLNDLIIESAQVSVQSLYNVIFAVLEPKVLSNTFTYSLFESLYPKTNTNLITSLLDSPDSTQAYLYSSGLEAKLKWTEKCLPFSKEIQSLFEEKNGFPDKNQIINVLLDQYFQWIYDCLDTFGINGAIEITISKLAESSKKSYHTEWCRFLPI